MTPFSRPQSSQGGFTLTEVALAMAIIGFIIGAIWAAGSSVNEKARSEQALSQLRMVVQNIRDIYGSSFRFSSTNKDVTDMMINAGVFPADMLVANVPTSPWQTQIVLRSGPLTSTFSYEWSSLAKNVCKALAGTLGGTSRDRQLVQITTDTKSYSSISDLDNLTPVSAPDCTMLRVVYTLGEAGSDKIDLAN